MPVSANQEYVEKMALLYALEFFGFFFLGYLASRCVIPLKNAPDYKQSYIQAGGACLTSIAALSTVDAGVMATGMFFGYRMAAQKLNIEYNKSLSAQRDFSSNSIKHTCNADI